jgi:hypothetical protein
MDYILSPKIAKKYYCETCNYRCSKESDYNKHLLTRKHKKSYGGVTMDDIFTSKNNGYECECGNTYKHRQGLWKHKKKCSIGQGETDTKNTDFDIDKELLIKMLLKNQDVMAKIAEAMPQLGNNSHNTNTTTNTNSHNTNNFNIQMFLNDHCKNAMNLTDFIHSLPITNETYDSTIDNGLTKTITSMMVNGLNDLDILQRPIHCTDTSRKTLYVKDSDTWEKDNELQKIAEGIRELSLKQRTMIKKWKDVNEEWATDENLQSRMTNLVFNSMTQIERDDKEVGKIVRSISKNVYLDNETKKCYV